MLASKHYPQAHVDAVRARIDDQLATYRAVAASADADALAAFGPHFFNDLVLVLELAFVHRLRGVEGKDGNPMNEVRLLATSLVEHDGVLVADKQIRLTPQTSVLGLAPGDRIALGEQDLRRLATAYLDAIERTFVAAAA